MKQLHEKGLPEDAILRELNNRLQKDFTYSSGKILGSMCAYPHPFARRVYTEYVEKNLGDPGLFPATAELEEEAVQMLGSLLSNPNVAGHIVSGGTEANILALWAARNHAKRKHGEVVLPTSAHLSFDKAADLLNLKLVKVGLNDHFEMDVKAAEESISPETVALVGVAGTTGLGQVDPIPELSEMALDHNIHLHVDAAFGGFVLPFLRELGFDVPDFDFRLSGVSSITVDPHKMGFAPIPAGGILFRHPAMMKAIGTKVPYLSGGDTEQTTLLGTRPGASSITIWALLKHLGKEGYKETIKRCMELTERLAKEVARIEGLKVATNPKMNIVGITSGCMEVKLLAQELRRRGWAISLFPSHIRVVVMPHIKPSHIGSFLKDLRDIVENSIR